MKRRKRNPYPLPPSRPGTWLQEAMSEGLRLSSLRRSLVLEREILAGHDAAVSNLGRRGGQPKGEGSRPTHAGYVDHEKAKTDALIVNLLRRYEKERQSPGQSSAKLWPRDQWICHNLDEVKEPVRPTWAKAGANSWRAAYKLVNNSVHVYISRLKRLHLTKAS